MADASQKVARGPALPEAKRPAGPAGPGRVEPRTPALTAGLGGRSRSGRRIVRTRPGRAFLAVRGLHRPGAGEVARAMERALQRAEGVQWARVDPVLSQVLVAFEDGRVGLGDLAAILDSVEGAHGVGGDAFAGEVHGHPADTEPITREYAALAADLIGASIGAAGRFWRLPPLPVELAAAIPALESLPAIHRGLQRHRDVSLALAGLYATLQGLTQGPLGLVVDASLRLGALGELTARRQAWLDAEPALCPPPSGTDGSATQPALCPPPSGTDGSATGPVGLPLEAGELPVEPVGERPTPLPAPLVDRYGQLTSLSSLVASGLTLGLTGSPRRAADVMLAGLPRAARAGVDGFAMQTSRTLARRGVIPMDPDVLRRLDRIDTVVLDADLLRTGRSALGEIVAVGDPEAGDQGEPAEEDLRRAAVSLFDPADPGGTVEHGGWTLAPFVADAIAVPAPTDRLARRLGRRRQPVLALFRDGRLVALTTSQPELHPATSELVASARGAAQDVVLAGPRRLAPALGADFAVPGGDRLTRSVRTLQAEGRVVLVVSGRPRGALRAADCGVGVVRPGDLHRPWGAHLICQHPADAAAVIDATRLARTASWQAVAVAGAGSLAAGVAAFGPIPGASRRAMTALQLASLAAIASGTWTASRLPPPRPHVDPAVTPPWHALAASAVTERLASHPGGLSPEEAAGRVSPEPEPRRAGLLGTFTQELRNPLTGILAAGAALSAAAGSLVDATMIAGVVGADAALGALQRLRTEAAVAELSGSLRDDRVRVLRSGTEILSRAGDLVPGDVVQLAAGDTVHADGRLLEATGLEMDESPLTGESLPVAKSVDPADRAAPVAERASMVYAGTSVAAGEGRAVVVAVGGRTEARRGAGSLTPPPTGVETRLRKLTEMTVPAVLAAGAGMTLNTALRRRPLREAVASGASLAAAAVPEGLPFVATVAQAAAARRLAERGVLVRNPQVLEALGRVDVLCFDKTGTLTAGRLQVRCVSDGAEEAPLAALGVRGRAILAAALRATPRRRPGGLPHPTDQAVVDAGSAASVRAGEGLQSWRRAGSLPFEPGRGYHAAVGRTRQGDVLSVKGAPETVLPRCRTWREPGGETVPVRGETLTRLQAAIERMARQGLRVLAVAERPGPTPGAVAPLRGGSGGCALSDDQVEDLELLGFLGVADETRPSAAGPVGALRRAGMTVVMMTGDHPSTAEAVASDLDLLDGGQVLTGSDVAALDDDELAARVATAAVFARVTPADKVRIVSAYQRAGRIVAMTGDGANDAQAIRLAQIGIAFGPRATQAARAAADLVVTNDELSALLESIAEGRALWAAVRDSLSLLLGGNLGEVAFATGASLLGGRSPLTTRQLLVVNLFTDLAPALAIAVQPPSPGRVNLAREGPDTSLAGPLVRDVTLRAVTTAGGTFAAWMAARATGTPARARTVALATLVGTQLGQTVTVGHRSPLVIATTALSAAGLVAIIETPGLSQFFDCRPLGPLGWSIAVGSSAAATAAGVVANRWVAR